MTFLGALTLLFVGLKLAHIIDWSWWLIMLPLYGGAIAAVAVAAAAILAAAAVRA